jgi:hypothetical protein
MAKKQPKRKRQAPARAGGTAARQSPTASVETDDQPAVAGTALSGVSAAAPATTGRRVERVSTPQTRAQRGSGAFNFEPLPEEDAAIPFDRVPYVPADLRRVAVMALLMLALIGIASLVISATVK